MQEIKALSSSQILGKYWKKALFLALSAFLAMPTRQAWADRPPLPFSWGAAFSAHQTEGGDRHSDWWDWELIPGKIAGNHNAQIATDHYNRYEEDFSLARSLNLNTVRISVSWPRIEPEEGKFDEAELEHYLKVVKALRARGIEPVVTLHHFTHPTWFHQKKGWANKDSSEIFAKFARKVASALKTEVRVWITFNEPLIQIIEGYLKGNYPPGISNFQTAVMVYENLVRAHAKAFLAIKSESQRIYKQNKFIIDGTGLALHMHSYSPFRDEKTEEGNQDKQAIEVLEHISQWAFLEAVQTGVLQWNIPPIPALPKGHKLYVEIPEARNTLDWVGINYYTRYLIARDKTNSLGARWEIPKAEVPGKWGNTTLIHPGGLLQLIRATKIHLKSEIPIVISENGLDDAKDLYRKSFIEEHVQAMQQAIKEGYDVRGYWYWSLTDNFEWLSGFDPRFGLIEIDYATLERKVRTSALWFKQFIETSFIKTNAANRN